MARKPNYGFDKRKKEMDRKAKQEAKRLRKAESAKERADETLPPPNETDGLPPR